MTAFLGISLWITLAMVVPGLMTVATVAAAFLIIHPSFFGWGLDTKFVEWGTPAMLISTMVLTQSAGILLERFVTHSKRDLLGPRTIELTIPEGIDPLGETHITIHPYEEYGGLYLLLAELRNDEDTQGHLQRCIAQFFLTNNSVVSFTVGILTAVALLLCGHGTRLVPGLLLLAFLIACLALSLHTQRIRFRVMAQALWAARRRRLESSHALPQPLHSVEPDLRAGLIARR